MGHQRDRFYEIRCAFQVGGIAALAEWRGVAELSALIPLDEELAQDEPEAA